MFDWFNIVLLFLVLVIVGFIAVAAKKTMSSSSNDPSRRGMKQAIEELRSEDVPCPRCGRQSSRMLGRVGYRKCDTCNHEFQHSAT